MLGGGRLIRAALGVLIAAAVGCSDDRPPNYRAEVAEVIGPIDLGSRSGWNIRYEIVNDGGEGSAQCEFVLLDGNDVVAEETIGVSDDQSGTFSERLDKSVDVTGTDASCRLAYEL